MGQGRHSVPARNTVGNLSTRGLFRCLFRLSGVWLNEPAETRDRTGDLQIFSLTLSQLSYRGMVAGRRWQI